MANVTTYDRNRKIYLKTVIIKCPAPPKKKAIPGYSQNQNVVPSFSYPLATWSHVMQPLCSYNDKLSKSHWIDWGFLKGHTA